MKGEKCYRSLDKKENFSCWNRERFNRGDSMIRFESS